MEFSSGFVSNKSSFTFQQEALDELLDEFWFFKNLFSKEPKVYLSTTDLWNKIQKMNINNQDQNNSSLLPPLIGIENVVQDEKKLVRKSTSKVCLQGSLSSSNIIQEMEGAKDTTSSKPKSSSMESCFISHNLLRAPSLPPFIERRKMVQNDEVLERKSSSKLARQHSLKSSKIVPQHRVLEVPYHAYKRSSDMSYHDTSKTCSNPIDFPKVNSSVLPHNLLRTPSLPPSREEKEYLRITNKLTRQASLSSSDLLPPSDTPNKVEGLQTPTRNPRIPRQRTRKETKQENSIKDVKTILPCPSKEVIRRSLSYKKSTSTKIDLEVEEVQGFKDLGFVFDKEEINKSLASIIPGLQEKKATLIDNEDENRSRGPYLSEAWLVQPAAPIVPHWVEKRSGGDMKTQLKFWARAVASNVRTEC